MGVDKDENGKNAAKQLKHFRNLIDNTASKTKFLAGFHRTESPSLPANGLGTGTSGRLARKGESGDLKVESAQADDSSGEDVDEHSSDSDGTPGGVQSSAFFLFNFHAYMRVSDACFLAASARSQ